MKLNPFVVRGRTFSISFGTIGEARDYIGSLPEKVIEYDGEICLYVRGEDGSIECVERIS